MIFAALTVASFIISDPLYYFSDFRSSYYPAGVAVLSSPFTLRPLTEIGGLGGFTSIPIVAYLFAPLGALRLRYAISLFDIIGLGVTVAAWMLLVRLARLGLRWRLLLARLRLRPTSRV
jgi:hypothetical protein